MIKYPNLSGESDVAGYDLGPNFICVYFDNRTFYIYTNEVTGSLEVETMKRLAQQGRGLGGYLGTKPYKKHSEKGTW